MTTLTPISVSPRKAGELLGVSRDHIYDLLNAQEIESVKSGARTLVTYQSLVDYIERQRRAS